jgi:uncharacterized membrane protein YraQ (UPF0718 family)
MRSIPVSTLILIGLAVIGVLLSLIKSRSKTLASVKFARGMFLGTFSELIGVMGIIGLILALLPAELIGKAMGGSNQLLSSLFGASIGAVTIIPGFIAFPLADTLLQQGAHIGTVAAFITTLTMVGVATYPLEVKHFGQRFTFARNLLSFVLAIAIALIMGIVL